MFIQSTIDIVTLTTFPMMITPKQQTWWQVLLIRQIQFHQSLLVQHAWLNLLKVSNAHPIFHLTYFKWTIW